MKLLISLLVIFMISLTTSEVIAQDNVSGNNGPVFNYVISSLIDQEDNQTRTLVKGQDDLALSHTLLYRAAIANSANGAVPITTLYMDVVSVYWENRQFQGGGIGRPYGGGLLSLVVDTIRHSQNGEGVTMAATVHGTVEYRGRIIPFVTDVERVTVSHLTGKHFEISGAIAARAFKRNISLDFGGTQNDSSTSFVALQKEAVRQELFANTPIAVLEKLKSMNIDIDSIASIPVNRITGARVTPDGSQILFIGKPNFTPYIGQKISVAVNYSTETEISGLPCTVIRIGPNNFTAVPEKRFIGKKFHVIIDAEIIPTG